MKMIIVVALAFVAAAAAYEEPIKTIRSEFIQQPEGYVFSYETENGILRQENGEIRQVLDEENKPQDVVVVRGSYSYPNSDGEVETINYFADETGYHAEGNSIPKPVSRR